MRVAPILVAILLTWASHAVAEDEHPGQHHAELPNLVGLRAGRLSVIERHEGETTYVHGMFLGVSYERVLIHGYLEAELSVPVAALAAEAPTVVMPMDLHLEIPFHPSRMVSPYLAAGPALDVVVDPEVEVFGGARLRWEPTSGGPSAMAWTSRSITTSWWKSGPFTRSSSPSARCCVSERCSCLASS